MNPSLRTWLLLVISLPTNSATARMRIWRALKAMGCGALRDGVYLLPEAIPLKQQLSELSEETVREGGSAWLLTVQAQSDSEGDIYRALFDRTAEHAEFAAALSLARKTLAGLSSSSEERRVG